MLGHPQLVAETFATANFGSVAALIKKALPSRKGDRGYSSVVQSPLACLEFLVASGRRAPDPLTTYRIQKFVSSLSPLNLNSQRGRWGKVNASPTGSIWLVMAELPRGRCG